MGSRKNITIITGSPLSLKTIVQVFRQLPSARWCYCGTDVPFSLHLDATLGLPARIPIGVSLQETAREFRQEYIDFIGRISRLNAENPRIDGWWLLSVSEKNPFISRVFLYFCYVKICQHLAGTGSEELLIITESNALSDSIAENLKSIPNCRVNRAGTELTGSGLRPFLKKIGFFGVYGSRILSARLFRVLSGRHQSGKSISPEICLHSFTDHRSLEDPGHYQNIFFRKLGPALDLSGVSFFYLIDVLPTTSYLYVLHRLLHYPENCHLLEEFITLSDLYRAHRFVAESGEFWDPGITMDSVRMGQILDGEHKRDGANTRREEAFLRRCAGERIASGLRIGTFISIFENHVWETMFRRAFRKQSPETLLVGYAHSIVNPLYTCYSVSAYERDLLPLPDVIAVNGIRAKNVLVQSGFAASSIVIPGALRYQHLKKRKFVRKDHPEKKILVALSAGLNDSLELTESAISALGDHDEYAVYLKCHPTLPFSILSRYLRALPGNMRLSEEPIEIHLPDADVLLYSDSTVGVEALALGVPPINVKSAHRIDINIFEGITALPSVFGPEQIREAIREVTSEDSLERLNDLQKIVDEFFTPVRNDFQKLFMGMKLPE